MRTARRLFTIIGATTLAYLLASALFGPVALAHWLITITAIDYWHPNWPNPTTVDTIAENLPGLAAALAFLIFATMGLLYFLQRFYYSPGSTTSASVSDPPMTLGTFLTMRPLRAALYRPSREEFSADLKATLIDAGAPADQAGAAADQAMDLATSSNPADWAGQVRDKALGLADLTGRAQRVISTEPHLEKTAEFLRAYGFRAVSINNVMGSDQDQVLNFSGILVWYRTAAEDAEDALIELLTYAHQAYMASMEDHGERAQRERVERYTESLKYVCQKLALRGFVPPELDAEIGRDGTATAEELHRWAIAQVVGTCSPMARMPLPTVERTIVGHSVGGQS